MNLLKERLDVVLTERGFYPSREKAKAAVMAGVVFVDGQKVDKAGTPTNPNAEIYIKENICPYVSRGGLKLEKALTEFQVDLNGKTCVDIGASTGGFTDCMLQHGASKVFAIDVGYGQLDYKLRIDPRVVNMEKINVRYLDPQQIDPDVRFISIDVSFISLRLVFPVAAALLKNGGSIVCLVKPQFEAGREQVGKNGIVREKSVHQEVLRNVAAYGRENGLEVFGVTFSPITGAKGNIEYLMYLKTEKAAEEKAFGEEEIQKIVALSHEALER